MSSDHLDYPITGRNRRPVGSLQSNFWFFSNQYLQPTILFKKQTLRQLLSYELC